VCDTLGALGAYLTRINSWCEAGGAENVIGLRLSLLYLSTNIFGLQLSRVTAIAVGSGDSSHLGSHFSAESRFSGAGATAPDDLGKRESHLRRLSPQDWKKQAAGGCESRKFGIILT